MPKRFKWTVEIEVDETWVADGFEMTNERLQTMMENAIPYATPEEVGGRVLSGPPLAEIAEVQGYASAAHKLANDAAGEYVLPDDPRVAAAAEAHQ